MSDISRFPHTAVSDLSPVQSIISWHVAAATAAAAIVVVADGDGNNIKLHLYFCMIVGDIIVFEGDFQSGKCARRPTFIGTSGKFK